MKSAVICFVVFAYAVNSALEMFDVFSDLMKLDVGVYVISYRQALLANS